jgi:hypothetical protein
MDMLIAGYERSLSDSMKYWRTRFIVLPSAEPTECISPTGETLNTEETRLLGIDKLAEIFGKYRWNDPNTKDRTLAAPRFLPTYLDPAACVMDESLISQLDTVHELGPLKKKPRSEKTIANLNLHSICKLMREAEPILIRDNRWHNSIIQSSFTGYVRLHL